MLRICKPFKNATPQSLTQGFTPKVHEANDFGGKYGTPLLAVCNSKVLNVIGIEVDQDEPDFGSLSAGYGVRLQSIDDPTITYAYWHCGILFPVKKGDIVLQGQPVAQMSNSGFVISGGNVVLDSEKLKPPFPGIHVHWSMGKTNPDGSYTALDPSTLIDWNIPIKWDLSDWWKSLILAAQNAVKRGTL